MSLVQRLTPLEGFDRDPCNSSPALTAVASDSPRLHALSDFPSLSRSLTPVSFFNSAGGHHHHAIHSSPSISDKFQHHQHHHLPSISLGPPRSLRTVLSYDALPRPNTEASRALHPVGGVTAYKVSNSRRVAQVLATTLACWLSSGIVFGFAALKPVLVERGVYSEFCPATFSADRGGNLGGGGGRGNGEGCYEQELRLNFFFAIASTTCNVSALPAGTILDRFGPRVTTVIGSLFLAVGSLLMGLAFSIPGFDAYIAGNVFLALGGTFVFVPSFQIANAFPKYSGLIVALITGAFDASAAVFLFYRLAYQASEGKFTPDKFFFGFLIVPVLIIVAQLTLMNSDGYKTVPQLEEKIEKNQDATRDVHDSDDEFTDRDVRKLREQRRDHRESVLAQLDKLMGDAEERQVQIEKREDAQVASGVWGVLHGKSAHEQIMTPWFMLITLLTVLQMLRMNFFIATIRAQYEYMLGSKWLARQVNSFFDVALPIGGVVATPFIGILLDRVSTAMLLGILVALITSVGILGSLPFMWAGYGNVLLFVLLRPLYYSAMSDYAAKVFGFATFGRVYGAIICFSGLVNLTQPLIDAVNHTVFNDNPIPINTILGSLGLVIGVALVMYVTIQGNREQRKNQHPLFMNERTCLIPEMIEEENSDYGTMISS